MKGKPTLAQLRALVGNPNAYAIQQDTGSYLKVMQPLSNAILNQHLKGLITVGTYVVKPPDQARTLVLDVDSGDTAQAEALKLVAALENLGVPKRSIGVEFSGNKGYHVWVVLGSYTQASHLRKLGLAAKALAEVECEVFPKQNEVAALGNLIKLPGSIHRKTKQANNFIISYPVPQPMSASVLETVTKALPELKSSNGGPPNPLECMAKIQEGVSEGGRNHALFHLATMLRRGGVADEHVETIVRATAERCDPPLAESEVSALLASSQRSGPICSTIPVSLQCSTCPVRAAKGLYAKPGQLRSGGVGELAVVELGKHDGPDVIEIVHPDIKLGKVKLR